MEIPFWLCNLASCIQLAAAGSELGAKIKLTDLCQCWFVHTVNVGLWIILNHAIIGLIADPTVYQRLLKKDKHCLKE